MTLPADLPPPRSPTSVDCMVCGRDCQHDAPDPAKNTGKYFGWLGFPTHTRCWSDHTAEMVRASQSPPTFRREPRRS